MYGCGLGHYGLRMGAQINRGSAEPLYLQLAAILRERIQAGELRRLPSQNDLAADYGVARDTARKALGLLREEGLIRTFRGKGSEAIPPG